MAAFACTMVLALVACLRAAIVFEPMPGWGLDPFVVPAAAGAFGPRESLLADVVLLVLSACVLGLAPIRRWRTWLPWLASLPLIAIVGLVHGMPDGPRPADLSPAMSWLAAWAAAGAIARGCADPAARRAVLAVLAGFTALLIAKGAVQLFVEHPQTLERFRADREQILAAQGLRPDSASARGFERRVAQPELTGWFSFSNVFASFTAAGTVALVALLVAEVRARRCDAGTVLLGLASILALATLLTTASKGAIAAGGAGLLLVLGAWLLPARWRTGRVAACVGGAAIVLPLLAVVARGALGDQIGELSVLFRWFYVEAASRIAIDHPLLGVGPGGFKDAYALAKNPLSPENAASPHSVLFDATATLGVLVGLLVAVAIVGAAVCASRAMLRRDVVDEEASRAPRLALVAGTSLMVAIGARFEIGSAGVLTPALAAAWVIGLVAWWLVAFAAWQAVQGTRAMAVAAGAAAITLIAHAQIEMAAVLVPSAALWAAWIGLACGAGAPDTPPTTPPRWARLAGLAPALLAVLLAAWPLPAVWAWQSAMLSAHGHAALPGSIAARLQAGGGDPAVARAAADELSSVLGGRVPPADIPRAMRRASAITAQRAAADLERAARSAPADGPTLRIAARARFEAFRWSQNPADAEAALELARRACGTSPASAQNWIFLAGLLEAATPDRPELAWDALGAAVELNPASAQLRFRRFEAARAAGWPDRARVAAERALAAHENARLDPLGAGLSEAQIAALKAALAGS